MDPSQPQRIFGLDALRAFAMLLGIALHGAMPYMTYVWPIWPADDDAASPLFDVIFWMIHLFRMEAFFLMAGFFSAMLMQRRGPRGFLSHRTKRLGLPLLLGMVTVIPITHLVWAVGLGIRYSGGFDAWDGDIQSTLHSFYTARPWWAYLGPIHLWFLMQLLVLCAAAWVCVQLAHRFNIARSTGYFITRGWRWCAARGLACLPLGLLAVAALFTQNQPMVGTQENPWPPINILAYYAVFFTAGWLTFGCQASLRGLARLWWIQLIAGTLLGLVFITLLGKFGQHLAAGETTPQSLDIQMRTVGGVATSLLVLGFTGLFLRLFNRPSQTMRWISDSAYWMYIAHLPVVITFNILLLDQPWPAWAKFAAVCTMTTAVLAASYQWCVRHTWVGRMLNGSKAPASTMSAA